MKFEVHAVINWVFFTIIVCPDSLISEMSRIAKCECIQCLLILQHSLPSERTFCVTVVKWGIFRRKKKQSVPFHPSFPSKLRCLLSPKGSLNSSTTLFRVTCNSSCLSLLLVAQGILPGAMFASQRQKLHSDDINQCLQLCIRNLVAMEFQMFMFLLIDCGKVLCSSANKLQLNSNVSANEE